MCIGRETNRDDGAVGADVLCRLLEWLLGSGNEKNSVCAGAARCESRCILDDVLGFGVIDIRLGISRQYYELI